MRIKRYIVILGIMIAIISLSSCKKEKKDLDLTDYVLSAQVEYDSDKWEIYKSTIDNKVYILKNGKYEKEEINNTEESLEIMKLPSVVTAKDLTDRVEITHGTYKSSLISSLEYLNMLYDSGYTKEFEGVTESFYEVYLKKDTSSLYKRLIITSNYIVEYSTEIINFNIDDYI